MRIGIDLGGTNTVVGLCDEAGKLICKKSVATCNGDPDGLRANMKRLAISVCEEAGVDRKEVTAIGLGVPGTFDKSTATLVFGTNLGMNDVCFAHAFQPEFDCPVRLDNDANCAALGEALCGAGMGSGNAVMVTLGTGVGGGIVIDGKLYTGANDIAGEIGHMVVERNGLSCNCGRHGCLEAYASASGMIRLAQMALEKEGTQDSLLRRYQEENGGELTAKMVCDARDAGDAVADEVFATYCDYLGCGLANLVNILQPDTIILGGGVAGYGEALLAPLREQIKAESLKGVSVNTRLVQATLGNDAGIIGAALL